MKKTSFILLTILTFVCLCSFTSVFATNTTMTNMAKDGANGVRNMVGGVENGIENVVSGVATGVRSGFNTVSSASENMMHTQNDNHQAQNTANMGTTDNTRNVNNNNGNTTGAANYTATRTSATENTGFFGMKSNTVTWLVLAITGIGLVTLLWGYFSQKDDKRYSDYE